MESEPLSIQHVPFNLFPNESSNDVLQDECLFSLSLRNRGSKLLNYHDIIRLRVGDTFMLVISPIHGASFFDLAVESTMMDGGNGAVVLVILER